MPASSIDGNSAIDDTDESQWLSAPSNTVAERRVRSDSFGYNIGRYRISTSVPADGLLSAPHPELRTDTLGPLAHPRIVLRHAQGRQAPSRIRIGRVGSV
jgi:hypothetical protein